MRRWKKLLLILFVLLLLSQIPFAYRRYQLGRLNAAIQQLNSTRTANAATNPIELVGVVHVHSSRGGHSTGTFDDIIKAARLNHLDFLVMTEHASRVFDSSALTLKGQHAGIVFVNGNEVSSTTGERLLLLPGDDRAGEDDKLTAEEILARRTSGLNVVAYPDNFNSWSAPGYSAVEVYNVYTNAKQISPLVMFFDCLWSYRTYPELLFAHFYQRPNASLKKWDELNASGKKVVALAGNDAHANIGLSLNDSSGKPVLGFKLDPYERSFRLVRMHALIEGLAVSMHYEFARLSENDVVEALKSGHSFIGFDLFGDTTGFRFSAQDENETCIMGDEIKLDTEVKLTVSVPVLARILLLKDGTVVRDENGLQTQEYLVKEKGSYRIEVYLPQLPGRVKDQPWIISNPIYVR
jgi:hypothetical protein